MTSEGSRRAADALAPRLARLAASVAIFAAMPVAAQTLITSTAATGRRTSSENAFSNESLDEVARRGFQLIDDNTGDAVGNSRGELEEGVARLQALLRRGYPDRVSVYLQLANAYHSLWSRAPGTREEALGFRASEAAAYRKLRELQPEKPEWDLAYVDALSDRAEQLNALEDITKSRARYAPARAYLGVLRCESGSKTEGARQLERAAQDLTRADDPGVGTMIVNAMAECAGTEAALRVKRVVDAAPARPRRGEKK